MSDKTDTQKAALDNLRSVLDSIPQSSITFAKSLLRNGDKYILSDKQLYYVRKLYDDYKPKPVVPIAPATPYIPPVPVDNSFLLGHSTDKVLSMFALAALHLQKPKIRLYFGETDPLGGFKCRCTMRVCPAAASSKYPGSLYLKPDYSDYSKWYGRIERDGRFVPGNLKLPDGKFDLEDGKQVSAQTIILAFLVDPIHISAQMGRLIGRCCYCNRPLEDERSTLKGYGPICAQHYALPWGE